MNILEIPYKALKKIHEKWLLWNDPAIFKGCQFYVTFNVYFVIAFALYLPKQRNYIF